MSLDHAAPFAALNRANLIGSGDGDNASHHARGFGARCAAREAANLRSHRGQSRMTSSEACYSASRVSGVAADHKT
jgi:hypothetical protein